MPYLLENNGRGVDRGSGPSCGLDSKILIRWLRSVRILSVYSYSTV
eukprot:COSAG02_NODE_5148_length_4590_cov_5.242485_7_plen_45_part_01